MQRIRALSAHYHRPASDFEHLTIAQLEYEVAIIRAQEIIDLAAQWDAFTHRDRLAVMQSQNWEDKLIVALATKKTR